MAASPIYNPPIPYVVMIPGGMPIGRMVRVQGVVPQGAQRFAINLQCGPNTNPRDDIALHLNFRFVEQCVVRNHLAGGAWGSEETAGGLPLGVGNGFEVLLLCDSHEIKIALNGTHFCEFRHRLSTARISHITIDGEVNIQCIKFEGDQPPMAQYTPQSQFQGYTAQPGYGPPPTYSAPPAGYAMGGSPMMQAHQSPMMGMPGGAPIMGQQQQQRSGGMSTAAAVGLGVGGMGLAGVTGYAIAGGFGSNDNNEESSAGDFFGDGGDWME